MSYFIFSASERFSSNLQATIQEATRGASLLVSHCKSVREESKFDAFYADVLEQSVGLTEEPCLPLEDSMMESIHITIKYLKIRLSNHVILRQSITKISNGE